MKKMTDFFPSKPAEVPVVGDIVPNQTISNGAPDAASSAIAAAAAAGAESVKITTTVDVKFPTAKGKRKQTAPQETTSAKKPKKLFNKKVASTVSTPKPNNVLNFTGYIDTTMEGVGDAVFAYHSHQSPLASKGGGLRGDILQAVARRVYDLEGFKTVNPPSDEVDVNGRKLPEVRASYDFGVFDHRNGTLFELEAKASRMGYKSTLKRWSLEFKHVKKDLSDGVVLIFEAPDAIRVFEWQGANYSTKGVDTEKNGGGINIHASRNQPNFLQAHSQLVDIMEERNILIAEIKYDDPRFTDLFEMTTRTADLYDGVPLGALSHTARGNVLENLVGCVLRRDLGMQVDAADVTECCDGSKRGKKSTQADFKVDGVRAEVKACQMQWNKSDRRFLLGFKNIKPENHEQLFLAWMTPRGVHVFEYWGEKWTALKEKDPRPSGHDMVFNAPSGASGYSKWEAAERHLLKGFKYDGGARYIAFVAFAEGDEERVMERGVAAFEKW